MAAKCGKVGCSEEAVAQLKFTDLMHTGVVTEEPIALCEIHMRDLQAQGLEETEVTRVREWLKN